MTDPAATQAHSLPLDAGLRFHRMQCTMEEVLRRVGALEMQLASEVPRRWSDGAGQLLPPSHADMSSLNFGPPWESGGAPYRGAIYAHDAPAPTWSPPHAAHFQLAYSEEPNAVAPPFEITDAMREKLQEAPAEFVAMMELLAEHGMTSWGPANQPRRYKARPSASAAWGFDLTDANVPHGGRVAFAKALRELKRTVAVFKRIKSKATELRVLVWGENCRWKLHNDVGDRVVLVDAFSVGQPDFDAALREMERV